MRIVGSDLRSLSLIPYSNAGSAALIVLLLLVATGTCILIRLRAQNRRLNRRAGGMRSASGGPVHLSSSSRADSPSDEALELQRLVEEGREDEEEGHQGRYADARGTGMVDKGKGRQRSSPRNGMRPNENKKEEEVGAESLFDVGEDEE